MCVFLFVNANIDNFFNLLKYGGRNGLGKNIEQIVSFGQINF